VQNVQTILVQGHDTGIEASSADGVLLIDTIHRIEDPGALFGELHRILKPDGLLFMHKGHMSMTEQRDLVEESGLFEVRKSQDLTILAAPRAYASSLSEQDFRARAAPRKLSLQAADRSLREP
jgi:SAM-dependent methyltransferase